MPLNAANLAALTTGLKALFKDGLGAIPSSFAKIATEIPSSTSEEVYAWLSNIPMMREWIGERYIKQLSKDGYRLKNRKFEGTLAVKRDDIDDDQLGTYAPTARMLGESASALSDQLVFDLLTNGFSKLCYDGQYFFDVDHPVIDANGVTQSVSNTGGGSGAPWFLLETGRSIKPVILQMRQRPTLETQDDGDRAFTRDEILYGVKARMEAGFGLWQMAYGSKQSLDTGAFNNGLAALQGFTRDGGQKLGFGMKPTLVVGPTNRAAAQAIVGVQYLANGGSNPNYQAADILVSPYLT
jgi:phage major head subunit gpT-like protein